jgi:sugar phosphate isomerase/epimerase
MTATRRVIWAIMLFALLLGYVTAAQASDGRITLKRGISIHEWLNWAPVTETGDYRWPPYNDLKEWGSTRDFARIKALGFDFVRLSVDPGPLLATESAKREEALERLEEAVRLVTAYGLKVVFDLHPVSQVPAWSDKALEVSADEEMAAHYRAVVTSVAGMLTRVGAKVTALELMNEPQYYPCDGEGGREWKSVLQGLVDAARKAASDLTLIVSGACGGNVKGLVQLDPAALDDDRVLYSFHFYEPLDFTHQGVAEASDVKGAPWPADAVATPLALIYSKLLIGRDESLAANDRAKKLVEVRRHIDRYIGNRWDEDRLKARFGEVRAWAERHGLPPSRLFLGEFSAMAATDHRGGALDADRYRWLDAVRREAEALGAPWAYWEYSNPHGMSLTTPDAKRRPDAVVLEALGLVDKRASLPAVD